jgi:prepilin signal peptidase PulO-like enzyme (type II secretory pathway)
MIFGSKKRRHANWPYRLSFFAIAMAAFMAVAISTLLTQPMSSDPVSLRLGFESTLLSRTFDVVSALWFFALGSCIGSFLNVVAYRLPLGISLTGYSRCPFCYVPIQTRDNVPVLGWIGLRGRCRACRLPIAPRYPIVEAIAGCIFLVVFVSELWLPGLSSYYFEYLGNDPVFARSLPYYRVAVLLALLTWLFTIALMRFDNSRMPLGMAVFGMFVAAVAVFVLPGILDLMNPFRGELITLQQIAIDGLTRIATGGVVGLLLALVTQRFLPLKQLPYVAQPTSNDGFDSTHSSSNHIGSDGPPSNALFAEEQQIAELPKNEVEHHPVIDLPLVDSVLKDASHLGASHSWALGLVVCGICVGVFGVVTVTCLVAILIGIAALVRPTCCCQQSLDPSLWLWLACLLYFVLVSTISRAVIWQSIANYLRSPYALVIALAVIAIGFSVHRITKKPAIA